MDSARRRRALEVATFRAVALAEAVGMAEDMKMDRRLSEAGIENVELSLKHKPKVSTS